MQYSPVQAGNVAIILGFLAMAAANAGMSFITTASLQELLGGLLTVGGVLFSWYTQVAAGLSTVAGFKTPSVIASEQAQLG